MRLGCLLLIAGLATPALPARAQLVERDLFAPGDGLVTRDIANQLDWLDLTETDGLSILDVQGGAGGYVDDGWRLATEAEVCGTIADRFGASICPVPFTGSASRTDPEAIAIAEELIGLFGATDVGFQIVNGVPSSDPFRLFSGYYDDGDLSDLEAAAAGISLIGDPVFRTAFLITENQSLAQGGSAVAIDRAVDSRGVFLVRVVPEPGTGALVAAGLLALARRPRPAPRASRAVRPGSGRKSGSHRSPSASPSWSDWSLFQTAGQLSQRSGHSS